MTPDTIRQAVYEIGQAAETEHEALLGGGELGRILDAQFRALGDTRRQLGCASRSEIESTLVQLATSRSPHQARVAGGALEVWRHAKVKE
ncbi:MAG: hypothetical protein EOO77_15950 [Oxalobacteraceae bacterium]|nr:MAG: hypothetical protein EOO77_15950 [Oxalobacteraceae bacterium]